MAIEKGSDTIMSSQQVADYLRISLSTVHHLTRSGKLKAMKVGKQWRYLKEDLDRYLEGGFEPMKKLLQEYQGDEKRAYPRVRCLIQGYAVVSLPNDQKWEGDGNILNISAGGLLFEARDMLVHSGDACPNVPVSLKLSLSPLTAEEYDLIGTVRYMQDGAKTRMGIEFQDPKPELSSLVEKSLSWN